MSEKEEELILLLEKSIERMKRINKNLNSYVDKVEVSTNEKKLSHIISQALIEGKDFAIIE